MALHIKYLYSMLREANRRHYEAEIAAGRKKRLAPELEAALFEYQNNSVLTLGGQIPQKEIDAEINKGAAQAGVTPAEFKEMVVNHHFGDPKDKLVASRTPVQ